MPSSQAIKYISGYTDVGKSRNNEATWAGARGSALTQSTSANSGSTGTLYVKSTKTSGRGGTAYHNTRAFLTFDLRGKIPNTSIIHSVKLLLWRSGGGGDGIRIVKTFIEDSNMDTDAYGYGQVFQIGGTLLESWSIESTHGLSSENGVESITLNNDAVDAMQFNLRAPLGGLVTSNLAGVFRLAIITELDHDNTTPTGLTESMDFNSIVAVSNPPLLEIDYSPPMTLGVNF